MITPASNDPSTINRGLYQFIRGLASVLFHAGWRLRVYGRDNVPRTGPVIIAPNHRSYADPPLVGVAVPREVHFLAKKELFSFGPFGWFLRNLNAHPLDRAGDVAAFRLAARVLKQGGTLIIFPEGRRIDTDTFGTPKQGIGMLAATSGAPIVPVYIHNSALMTRFKRVEVHFGRPIAVTRESSYLEIAARVMDEIAALKAARTA